MKALVTNTFKLSVVLLLTMVLALGASSAMAGGKGYKKQSRTHMSGKKVKKHKKSVKVKYRASYCINR